MDDAGPGFIPDEALYYGFVNQPVSVHLSKTLMLEELTTLLASAPPDASRRELRQLVVEENVLLKSTVANRIDHFQRLSGFYGLDPGIPLYRLLRVCWEDGAEERPLLALLIAAARDPLLRATAPWILEQEVGVLIAPSQISEELARTFPDRYSVASLRTAGQNLASSWRQAGHLSGKVKKIRSQAAAGPVATAMALFLAHLAGGRGQSLFESLWVQLLDLRLDQRHELAFRASQRGLLEYRRVADVVEIGFSRFERLLAAPLGGHEHG